MIYKINLLILCFCFSFLGFAQKEVKEIYPTGKIQFEGDIIELPYSDGDNIYLPYNSTSNITDVTFKKGDIAPLKDGKWLYYYEDGSIAMISYFKKGKKVGKWISYFKSGIVASEENYETGEATYYYQNGQKAQEGIINNNGLKHGYWKGWYENGGIMYEGEYQNGMGLNIKHFSKNNQ